MRCSLCPSACVRVMPQPSNFDPTTPPPLATRRCPACGEPMFVVRAEPGAKSDLLQATFECATCAYGETAVVRRRSSIAP